MGNNEKTWGTIAGLFFVAVIVIFIEAWVLMALWNAIIPVLFIGAPIFAYWQSMGIIIISNILFGHRGVAQYDKN